eukprot:TRINITY_DN40690_c0_g1_i1.p1 TRINITY_DN40690_c0_g1~~TRINITY_DN40690_c0_g1_i1.p1  ORF type:complete len:765 (-),score=156.53 TRINITY_DN40690_c0_g1_i1:22-2316(-)
MDIADEPDIEEEFGLSGRCFPSVAAPTVRENADLEAYYGAVLTGPNGLTDGCWATALSWLRTPAPLVIRPLGTHSSYDFARDLAEVGKALAVEAGTDLGPKWLEPWSVWQVTRTEGQQWQTWQRLTQLLFRAQKSGECAVQELSSTIPAQLLDVREGDTVCDLCAAPGSKTLQLLEALSAPGAAGLLVANELCPRRASLLAERLRRDPGSASSRCVVTRCNAAIFPTLFRCERIKEELGRHVIEDGTWQALRHGDELGLAVWQRLAGQGTSQSQASSTAWSRRRKVKFDRVLADVPCSGDGTLRKSPDIWCAWSAARGLANFPRQLAILRRALELLQEGGRVVYSTCSLNPVECEAVVAAAVALHNATKAKQGGGYVVLEDAHAILSQKMPGSAVESLQRGLRHWPVPSPGFTASSPTLFSSWEEVPTPLRARRSRVRAAEAEMDKEGEGNASFEGSSKGPRIRQEMFPTPEAKGQANTGYCVRVMPGPGIEAAGGFFAAALRKMRAPNSPDGLSEPPVEVKTEGYKLWAAARLSFPRLKRNSREAPALLSFFGLLCEEADAASAGVERFPLEKVAWAPGSRKTYKNVKSDSTPKERNSGFTSLVLLSHQGLELQHHADLRVLGGGQTLFVRMDDDCEWAQSAGLATTRQFFTWRAVPSAAALLSKCCTRRLLCLTPSLLLRILRERRLPAAELVSCGLDRCMHRNELQPGGVIIVPRASATLPLAAEAFAGLLSCSELLLLGSSDLRERWLNLLEPLLAMETT